MKHLEEVKEDYLTHLAEAIQIALSLIIAFFAVVIHAVFPPLFTDTASSILKGVIRRNTNRTLKDADHIQIRYNTKNEGGPLVWRVIVNNQESLASFVEINGHTYGEETIEDGVRKMNIACDGKVSWTGTKAVITTRLRSII